MMGEHRELCINIDDGVFADLIEHARRMHTTPGRLAGRLFNAAFSAMRVSHRGGHGELFHLKPMADLVPMLWIAGNDTLAISRVTGLTETLVLKTLDRWHRQQMELMS